MKNKNIDVLQFKNIDELYHYVDNNAFDLKRTWILTDIWVKYRDKTNSDEEKKKSQFEIDCLIFDIKGDTLFSQVYSIDKETRKPIGFPDPLEFEIKAIDYVQERIGKAKSPILRARYNHLLWKCPNGIKHTKYAIGAIENYIQSIETYCTQFEKQKEREIPSQVGELFERLLIVANSTKTNLEPIKRLTTKLLFNSDFEFYTKHSLLSDMLEYPKLFKSQDFENTLGIIENVLKEERTNTVDFSIVNYYIPTAIQIATKTNSDVKLWYNEKGNTYLKIADYETDEERFWMKLNNYASAINAFMLAGNTEKTKEAELLYAELKPKVKLPTTKIDFDAETQQKFREFHNSIKNEAEMIAKQKPEEVYKVISSGFFFPKHDDVHESSKDGKNSFLEFVTTVNFDKNKNITKREKKADFINTYSHQISLTVLPYLHYILIPGIKSGNLTFENFIEYIATKSWIGKPHLKYDLSGEGKSINWIGLLSPSIIEFFMQIKGMVSSKYYKPSFVLCVDSLTLKFEGLFRDFCARLNVPTSVNRNKGMQETYIHNVLENDIIKKFFNDDDLLLFNYLFSNEDGLNIRNNVAHNFYDFHEYESDQMFLLVAALLRLAKYDYKIKSPAANII